MPDLTFERFLTDYMASRPGDFSGMTVQDFLRDADLGGLLIEVHVAYWQYRMGGAAAVLENRPLRMSEDVRRALFEMPGVFLVDSGNAQSAIAREVQTVATEEAVASGATPPDADDALALPEVFGLSRWNDAFLVLFGRAPSADEVASIQEAVLWNNGNPFPGASLEIIAAWNFVRGEPVTPQNQTGPLFQEALERMRREGVAGDFLDSLDPTRLFGDYARAVQFGLVAPATTFDQYLQEFVEMPVLDGTSERLQDYFRVRAESQLRFEQAGFNPRQAQVLAQMGVPLEIAAFFVPRQSESYTAYLKRIDDSGAFRLLADYWSSVPPDGIAVPEGGFEAGDVSVALGQAGVITSPYEFFQPGLPGGFNPLMPVSMAGEPLVSSNAGEVVDALRRARPAHTIEAAIFDFVKALPADIQADAFGTLMNTETVAFLQAQFQSMLPSLQEEVAALVAQQRQSMDAFRQQQSERLSQENALEQVVPGRVSEIRSIDEEMRALRQQFEQGSIAQEDFDTGVQALESRRDTVTRQRAVRERVATGGAAILQEASRAPTASELFFQRLDLRGLLQQRAPQRFGGGALFQPFLAVR